jgi:hypothetical protein
MTLPHHMQIPTIHLWRSSILPETEDRKDSRAWRRDKENERAAVVAISSCLVPPSEEARTKSGGPKEGQTALVPNHFLVCFLRKLCNIIPGPRLKIGLRLNK